MPIAPNTRFDHYEILGLLGKGGMGEVLRAKDTRLDREVAIKILPAEFVLDADRLRRFEQEAKATSALNHANILTVYDFGTHEGNPYLVMELLDGEELRAQLDEGALPVRKAIEYAQQIVAGLAAAHTKGIVHRDLKPENLFVTHDGRVKILDFGLAKLRPPRNVSAGSDVATAKQYTSPGTVMGTVAYMSPEQVQGKDLDHRSDIFSFGIILHEMLSGQRAFEGESQVEVMHAILKADPPELTNSKIPTALDRIVRRCLEKKPEMRFHSSHDLGFALEALTIPSGANQTQTVKALPAAQAEKADASRFHRVRLWQAVCLLLAIAGAIFAWLFFRKPTLETSVTRFTINVPNGLTPGSTGVLMLALSPDGRRLVLNSGTTINSGLWLHAMDSFGTQPLPGTEGGHDAFWSPDGKYIAFFAADKLKKLDTRSGVIETICTCDGRVGDWNREGIILFTNAERSLSRINATGGKPETITELDAKRETAHYFPTFLPDGRHYLFEITGGENPGIYVGSIDSKERKLIIPLSADSANTTKAVWSPAGYILYAMNRSTLLAQAFDPDRLELKSEPFRVAENVIVTGAGFGAFTVAGNGTLAYMTSSEVDKFQLTWADRSGKRLSAVGPVEPWRNISLSPDEQWAALTRNEPSRRDSVWLLDLSRNTATRFVQEGANLFPSWSPDGKQLAFSSVRNSPPVLFLKPVEGNVPEKQLLEPKLDCYPSSWSPDGKLLLYTSGKAGRFDIWMLPMTGEGKPQPLLQTKASEQRGKISPDGNWLAYQSDESGDNEIYVTQFPQPARSWRISTSGGTIPYWRGDGKELYFVAGNKLMAASVTLGAEFQAGPPQPLLEIEGTNPNYAPSKDGQRFLVPVVTEKAPAPPINVVLNWTADLKK